MRDAAAATPRAASPLVLHGADVVQRMADSPGIYVGRFPIPALLRVVGHTATAEVTDAGIAVTELVGLWQHLFQEIELHRPKPYYGNFSDYRWVKVADVDRVEDYRRAAVEAKALYHNRLYTASSNRFVSTVLRKSGVPLTPDIVQALGSSPGIQWRYRF